MNPFAAARDAMMTVHPELPWVALTAAIWIAQYLVRRYRPSAWQTMFGWLPSDFASRARQVVQALPSIVAGAAIPAMASGGDWKEAAKGAAFGALAPLVHHALKAAPGPYQGALRVPASVPVPANDPTSGGS